MGYRLSRFVVSPAGDFQEFDLTFPLERDTRKVIHGIVTDEETGEPLECAIVKFFRIEGIEVIDGEFVPDPCTVCDPDILIPVGHAITDDCGQFLFAYEPDILQEDPEVLEPVVIKIFKLENCNLVGDATECPNGTCDPADGTCSFDDIVG